MSTLAEPLPRGGRALPRRRMSAPAAFVAAVALAIVGYVTYRGLGALTGDVETTAVANADRIDRLQRALGIDVERNVQASWLATGVTGDLLAWFYTFGYWPSVAAALVATAVYDRRVLRRLAAAFALSGAVGLVVITVFPLAPPRLVGGADDHVARSELLSALAHPSAVFNPYAAMPSFHVAWTVLAALAGSQLVRGHRLAGAAVWSVPATMSIAVVTTGNHWMLDVAAGAMLAVGAWWSAPHVLGVLRRNIRSTPTPVHAGSTSRVVDGFRRPTDAGRCSAAVVPSTRSPSTDTVDRPSRPTRRRTTMTNIWLYRQTVTSGQTFDANALVGYDVEATDGHIGKIDEASTEADRSHIVVDTGFWIFGKKRLVPAGVVKQIDHDEGKVWISLSKDEVKEAPDWDANWSGDDDTRSTYEGYYGPYGW